MTHLRIIIVNTFLVQIGALLVESEILFPCFKMKSIFMWIPKTHFRVFLCTVSLQTLPRGAEQNEKITNERRLEISLRLKKGSASPTLYLDPTAFFIILAHLLRRGEMHECMSMCW